MNKIKLLIKILIVIAVLISITIVAIKFWKKIVEEKKQTDFDKMHEKFVADMEDIEKEEGKKLKELASRSEYFILKNVIDQYITDVNNLKKSQNNAESIIKKLDEEYISFYNINQSNLINLFKEYGSDNIFIIDKVYIKDIDQIVSTYIIYGRCIDTETSTVKNDGFIIQKDDGNSSYTLMLYDYLEEKQLLNLKENDVIDFETRQSIEKNEYNTFERKLYSEKDLVLDYWDRLEKDWKYDKQHLYTMLEEEYKQNFNSEKEFEEYINNLNINLKYKDYSINNTNNSYICVDLNNNIYTFNRKSILEYTIKIDMK